MCKVNVVSARRESGTVVAEWINRLQFAQRRGGPLRKIWQANSIAGNRPASVEPFTEIWQYRRLRGDQS